MSLLSSELCSALDDAVKQRDRRAAAPAVAPPDLEPTAVATSPAVRPRVPAGTYTLTHTNAGWVLLTRYDSELPPRWTTPLAQHGASPDAPVRVAQAVCVRVLHELGVDVTGWSPLPAPRDELRPDVVAHSTPAPREHRIPRGFRGH